MNGCCLTVASRRHRTRSIAIVIATRTSYYTTVLATHSAWYRTRRRDKTFNVKAIARTVYAKHITSAANKIVFRVLNCTASAIIVVSRSRYNDVSQQRYFYTQNVYR